MARRKQRTWATRKALQDSLYLQISKVLEKNFRLVKTSSSENGGRTIITWDVKDFIYISINPQIWMLWMLKISKEIVVIFINTKDNNLDSYTSNRKIVKLLTVQM